jgi:uncharacterized membrane protein YkoI
MLSLRLLLLFLFSTTLSAAEDKVELPLTQQSAAEIIQLESSGKILSVNNQEKDGEILFLIKVLHTDGKIKIYSLEASTGLPPK